MRNIALAAVALAGLSAPARADGFYVNAFAGMTLMDSTVTVDGTKLVDQGGDALMGGARAGWGYSWPSSFYLGAEVEAFGASGRSRVVINGVGYSYAIDGGAGAFGRIGWRTRGNSIFFARGGTQALFTNQGTEFAPALGIGAEVPFGPGWHARIDITYAWTSQDQREFFQGTAGIVRRF